MKKIFKAVAIIATSFALMACNGNVSSDPQTITNGKYSGSESQFPKNISLVTIDDGAKHVAKVKHGTNYEFEITYEPYSTNKLETVSYVASNDLLQNVDSNGQPSFIYLIHVKYPDDDKFTKTDIQNLTSQMIWPLIIRQKLSKPEADAAVAVFNEYARDYMVAYSKAQNFQGEEREKIFSSSGKYAGLKHNVDYASLPKLESVFFIQQTDNPNSNNSKVLDMKITLKNGKTYNYVSYAKIPPAANEYSFKKSDKWRNVAMFVTPQNMENSKEIVENMYNKVKNDDELDFELANTVHVELLTLKKF